MNRKSQKTTIKHTIRTKRYIEKENRSATVTDLRMDKANGQMDKSAHVKYVSRLT